LQARAWFPAEFGSAAGINAAVATRKLWLVTHPLPSVPAEPDKPRSWHRVDDLDRGSAKLGLN